MDPSPDRRPFSWNELWRAGDILILLLGLMLLAGFGSGLLCLALLLPAAAALVLGIGRRSAGWLVPAGVLGGVALGVLLVDQSAWLADYPQLNRNALHLVAQGAGWLSITVLTRRFTGRPQYWPLLPGLLLILAGIMILISSSLVGISMAPRSATLARLLYNE
jgi:hypothetical protein